MEDEKERKGKQEKAPPLLWRQGGHICPQCGQFRGSTLTLFHGAGDG